MRSAFIRTVEELAEKDKRIFFLTGDLGYSVLENFATKFPDRFLNVGVAEQNMIGIAAGLALSGKIPIVYSIATFATLRPYEFIRNDVCYQNLNVKIVGAGAGFSYPHYAATHQAIDDAAAISVLPNIAVLNPGDPVEARLATKAAIEHTGPVYLRIGKRGEPVIHKNEPEFKIGKGIVIQRGSYATIFVTGAILDNVMQAVRILEEKCLLFTVVSMPTLKPIDREIIEKAERETDNIITVEEAFEYGGLGMIVADVMSQSTNPKKTFHKIAIPHRYPKETGSQDYLREIYRLTPREIAGRIAEICSTP